MTPSPVNQRIYVAGHMGMVGSAIMRCLQDRGGVQLVTRTHADLDLVQQAAVRDFMQKEKPDQIYLAAAVVGGILANDTYPAQFLYDNLMIQANVLHEAWQAGVSRVMVLASSCIYPKLAPQPMNEGAVLTGKLEPTNEPYAIAKIAAIKLCESYNRQYGADFRCVAPANLYGPGDDYHPENSHVIPALIRRFHEATVNRRPKVVLWGSGTPQREFLYVDDMAVGCVHVMNLERAVYEAHTRPMQGHINIGSGKEITIRQLAGAIARVVGYEGEIDFDSTKPDGAPRKCLDSSMITTLGWRARVPLEEGLRRAYSDFLQSDVCELRGR
ncbi:MAG: GDP-L-fucose synthase [Nitrospirota bacterium]